jgi:hypothetical protein
MFPGLINITSGLLFIGISIPLVKRKIKMNSLYGFRMEKSFKSEENWYNINAYGGKELMVWSVPVILLGIICFFIPSNNQYKEVMPLILCVGPIVICLMIALIRTLVYANKL